MRSRVLRVAPERDLEHRYDGFKSFDIVDAGEAPQLAFRRDADKSADGC
jgi:hypothetical protein